MFSTLKNFTPKTFRSDLSRGLRRKHETYPANQSNHRGQDRDQSRKTSEKKKKGGRFPVSLACLALGTRLSPLLPARDDEPDPAVSPRHGLLQVRSRLVVLDGTGRGGADGVCSRVRAAVEALLHVFNNNNGAFSKTQSPAVARRRHRCAYSVYLAVPCGVIVIDVSDTKTMLRFTPKPGLHRWGFFHPTRGW